MNVKQEAYKEGESESSIWELHLADLPVWNREDWNREDTG